MTGSIEGRAMAPLTVGIGSAGGCDLVIQNPRRYPEAGARQLRPWLEPLLAELAPAASSLTVRFTSDREVRRLNRVYRQKDTTTDVLSFSGDLDVAGGLVVPQGDGHLGDIVISVPTARRQAEAQGHGVERELRVLVLHGALHCMGYDHTNDDGTMERLESRLRARWIDHG